MHGNASDHRRFLTADSRANERPLNSSQTLDSAKTEARKMKTEDAANQTLICWFDRFRPSPPAVLTVTITTTVQRPISSLTRALTMTAATREHEMHLLRMSTLATYHQCTPTVNQQTTMNPADRNRATSTPRRVGIRRAVTSRVRSATQKQVLVGYEAVSPRSLQRSTVLPIVQRAGSGCSGTEGSEHPCCCCSGRNGVVAGHGRAVVLHPHTSG